MTAIYYQREPLRFQCTGCGKCCLGNHNAYVELAEGEAEKIRAALDLSSSWFKRHYMVKLFNGKQGLRITEKGRCVLLDSTGKCRAYNTRPAQCRTYPFWPEIIFQESTWKKESRKCEGINQGAVVDLKTIEKNLKRSME